MKVKEVCDYFGTGKDAAEAIGLGSGSFYQWRQREYIPIVEQLEFERVTRKKLVVDWDEYFKVCKKKHQAKYLKRGKGGQK